MHVQQLTTRYAAPRCRSLGARERLARLDRAFAFARQHAEVAVETVGEHTIRVGRQNRVELAARVGPRAQVRIDRRIEQTDDIAVSGRDATSARISKAGHRAHLAYAGSVIQ
jgi:hypothetical protein